MKCEEEVAKLPLPPLAHKNGLQPWPQRLSLCRDHWSLLVMETPGLFFYRDPWSLLLSSETFSLHFMLFNFWRLSLHTFKCLIYYVTIYN